MSQVPEEKQWFWTCRVTSVFGTFVWTWTSQFWRTPGGSSLYACHEETERKHKMVEREESK